MKRALDIAASSLGLLASSPLLLLVALAIWLQDQQSPFYVAPRAARGGGSFQMVKFRSMVINADKSGVSSTSASDRRITPVGHFVRKYKIDELPQLWNVVTGDMSLAGPRPQVLADTALYTQEEMRMLTVRPGITDLASIVFADEGEILRGATDPDARYNEIIRPWKSRLALLYVDRHDVFTDIRIILLTLLGIVSRDAALAGVQPILDRWGAEPLLKRMASRKEPLLPAPPPGSANPVPPLNPH